jgi:PE-PPE domain
MKRPAHIAAILAAAALTACTTTTTPTPTSTPPTPAPAGRITYTLEPFDGDGVLGVTQTITQMQFGGTQCPCAKVRYPATGLQTDVQKGADEIWRLVQKGTIHDGDQLMGFSLGVQVLSTFMAQHPLPAGVKLLLAGDTHYRNQQFLNIGIGIPWNTPNAVVMVANEFDGWSDFPDRMTAPGYLFAVAVAATGTQLLHNYVHAQLGNPANVVEVHGNITTVLIPTQKLPLGTESQRASIDGAYTRTAPTPGQLAAATAEQSSPGPIIGGQTPEPVAQ